MIRSTVLKSIAILLLASVLLVSGAGAQQSHSEAAPTLDLEDFDPDIIRVDEARLQRAMDAYTADETLQLERPEWEPEVQAFEPRNNRSGPNPIARAIAAFFNAIGSVLGYILFIVIVLAILAGLYMVFGESISLRGRQKEKKAEADISIIPDLRPEEARAHALLDDADRLAAEGKFAEAVHLLLFRSIDDIQEKHSGIIARSLTAREIGALGILPDPIRNALSPIIRIVERSFFGGREVDANGWQEARASYETFAFGEAWA
ncbi:MAG: hypothetical protein K0U61_02135 [Alphaproteobacteria bacterium]|nr:hypothetical protein [Alphaproteobacteria bacterium]